MAVAATVAAAGCCAEDAAGGVVEMEALLPGAKAVGEPPDVGDEAATICAGWSVTSWTAEPLAIFAFYDSTTNRSRQLHYHGLFREDQAGAAGGLTTGRNEAVLALAGRAGEKKQQRMVSLLGFIGACFSRSLVDG